MFKLNRSGGTLDEEVREWRLVAQQYLDGVPVKEICDQIKQRGSGRLPTTDQNIRRHLRYDLGDTRTINFGAEVYTFPCEPIVDKPMQDGIVALMNKRKAMPNRKPQTFLLTGSIYCAVCGRKLQTQPKNSTGVYYYLHTKSERNGCEGLKCIRADHIDAAVLKECFVFFGVDKKAYEEAIAEFLPDDKARKQAEDDVKTLKQTIASCIADKDAIVNKLLKPTTKLSDSIVEAANRKVEASTSAIDSLRDDLRQKHERLASMMTPEQYKAQADKVRQHWQRVFTGFDTMEEMPWQNRQYLIDQMFDGTDDQGRPFGVYVRKIKAKVFDYEIYGRFTEGARFLKGSDDDYRGPETEAIEAEWRRDFDTRMAAYRAKRKHSKSIGLEMGGRGLEPLTSCVSSTRSSHLS